MSKLITQGFADDDDDDDNYYDDLNDEDDGYYKDLFKEEGDYEDNYENDDDEIFNETLDLEGYEFVGDDEDYEDD